MALLSGAVACFFLHYDQMRHRKVKQTVRFLDGEELGSWG